MSYREKLEGFNSTGKYMYELIFLKGLISDSSEKVLDYGCGTGFGTQYIRENTKFKVFGYDVKIHNDKFSYIGSVGKYDCVYFMHSLAHIENVETVLSSIEAKEFIVITPNKNWLDIQTNENYKPDTTVINHFTLESLNELFIGLDFEVEFTGGFGVTKYGYSERIFIKAKVK